MVQVSLVMLSSSFQHFLIHLIVRIDREVFPVNKSNNIKDYFCNI